MVSGADRDARADVVMYSVAEDRPFALQRDDQATAFAVVHVVLKDHRLGVAFDFDTRSSHPEDRVPLNDRPAASCHLYEGAREHTQNTIKMIRRKRFITEKKD